MNLDPNTLVTLVVVTSLAAVAALAIVASGHRVAGLWSLAGAALSMALMFSVFGAYHHLAPDAAVITSNTALALMLGLTTLAIAQLRSQRIHPALVAGPAMLALLLNLMMQSQAARVIGADILSALQVGIALRVLVREGGIGVGRGRHILLTSLVVLCALFLVRLVAIGAGMVPVPPPEPDLASIDAASYLVGYLVMIFAILGFVLAAAEITADQNHRLALQDVLTGLPNRRAMLDALAQHWYASVRAERPLTLLMIDVDHFKMINDRYGHPAGDALLRQLARLMRSRLRAQDLAGRFGGEEFMVILPETAPEGAKSLAETLRAEIAGMMLRTRGKSLSATVSIGMYTIWPTETDTIPEFIRRADDALYRAKAAGRNRVTTA